MGATAAGGTSLLARGRAEAQPEAAPAPAPPPPAPPRSTAEGTSARLPAPFATPARAFLRLKPDKGFIDEAFALEPEAGLLAVIRTDSASFAHVDVVSLASGKAERRLPLADAQASFERVLFSGPAGGVVVIARDPTSGRRTAQYFSPEGRPLGMVGPTHDFGVAQREGARAVFAWDRTTRAGDTLHTVTPHRLDAPARAGKAIAFTIDKGGELKTEPLKVLGWLDGYTQLIGQRPGGYDKAKDVRLPDRAAIYDVLDRRVVWEAEIADVYGWAASHVLRGKRPLRTSFLVLAEDEAKFTLLAPDGRQTAVTLPVPLDAYEPRSLEEHEESSPRRFHFSLAVDPLNATALARGKKDTPYLDLFNLRIDNELGGGPLRASASAVLRAPLDDRPVTWQLGGPYLALLRRHRSFSRGANEIELYRVGR